MGSIATSAAAGAPWMSPHAMTGGSASSLFGGRGMDAKQPLYVQISQPGSARSAVLGFLARAALMLVAFSAVGALLDERGLGKGMGMNAGSKHVQEAEQNGRKIKFDDVKGVEEAKQELEEIVMCTSALQRELFVLPCLRSFRLSHSRCLLFRLMYIDLKDPSRFTRLGGKLPRGLLLTGM
jgi:ATP-dependent metalloprotease